MPSRVDVSSPGCAGALLGYSALCLLVFRATRSWWWVALAVPALLGLGVMVTQWIRGLLLLAASRRFLESRGVRCLVIHSDSPVWDEYIRSRWLPRIGPRAVTLNWSDRSTWGASLEVRLFNHFVKPSEGNFNPAVVVLRGFQQPHVFRFFFAFQQAKHGRRHYLETLEADLFKELDV